MENQTIANLIERAHGRKGRRYKPRLRRVVARLDGDLVARVDAVLLRWKGVSRAALIRALVVRGLDAIGAPELPDEQCVAPVLDAEKRASTCPAREFLQRELTGCGVVWVCPKHAAEIDAKSKAGA